MAITPEQAKEIKQQLLTQVDSQDIPNKKQVKEQILGLNEEQLEQFLKQNQEALEQQGGGEGGDQSPQKPVFQAIIDGDIPSHQIAENNKSIAILELNPLSKGHSIVLPKQQTTTEKIPKSAMTLAQKIAKKIKTKLKPEDIKIETSSFQDYPMINIIPIYKDEKLEKTKATDEELEKLQKKLQTKKRSPREKKQPKSDNLPEIGFRIP